MHTSIRVCARLFAFVLVFQPSVVKSDAGDVSFEVLAQEAEWIGIVQVGATRSNQREIPPDTPDVYQWQKEAGARVLRIIKGDQLRNLILEFDNPYVCPDASFGEG